MSSPRLTNDELLVIKRALNDFAMDKDQHAEHSAAAESALSKVNTIIKHREKTKTKKVKR